MRSVALLKLPRARLRDHPLGGAVLPSLILTLLLTACAGQTYSPPGDFEAAGFLTRAVTQELDGLSVSAAVPGAEETQNLFGLPLYEQGVQPIWLEIQNHTRQPVRLSLWSIDPNYFSPLEVAWMNRRGFDQEGRTAMARWFYERAMPRRILPGESRSGFVYTHPVPGTKGFNVDIISRDLRSYYFTFFVPMPGFTADYMTVNLKGLYAEEEFVDLDADGLRSALKSLPCCSSDGSGSVQGAPFNVALVGTGLALRRALLRAGWQETAAGDALTAEARRQHYRGRPPDGTFYQRRADGSERKELRLWLTPLQVDEERVWLGQVGYVVSEHGKGTRYLIDPDLDAAVRYLMQNFWYSQSVQRIGFASAMAPVPADTPVSGFGGTRYFTNGLRLVLWLSELPVAMDHVVNLDWQRLPSD